MRNALLNICTIFLEIDLDFVKIDHNIWNPEIVDMIVWTLPSYDYGPTGFERFHAKHCRCCYGLTPWPQWTWNSSQVCRLSCPHFFFFELTPHVSLCFPRGSKQLSRGWCIDPVQGGNIPSGKNPSEILPQVKIAPKRYLRWISFEEYYFLVRIPSCPPLLLVIPAYLHPDSVFVHNSHFKYIWHHCRTNKG